MSLDVSLYTDVEVRQKYLRRAYWYEANITSNLGEMAAAVGIYHALWEPKSINAIFAEDIIGVLERGLKILKDDPKTYKEFNPKNGWGDYEGLIAFVDHYLTACRKYRLTRIEISR